MTLLYSPQLGGEHAMIPYHTGNEPELSGMRPHVLVVEDDEGCANLLRVLLIREGYRVTTVHNGDHALTQAAAARPNLMISDLVHPGLDGLALCHAIRATPTLADLPLIVWTTPLRSIYDSLWPQLNVWAVDKMIELQPFMTLIRSAVRNGTQGVCPVVYLGW